VSGDSSGVTRMDIRCGNPIFHRTSEFNKPHKQGISQTQALINVTTITTQDYTGNKPPMDYNINPSYTYNHTLVKQKISTMHTTYAPSFLITMQHVSIFTYAPSP